MSGTILQNREEAFQKMLTDMRPYFWDTKPEDLDIDKNSAYIISRLLNMGGMPGYLWVQELYNQDDIIHAVIHRRDMRPVVRNFMAQQYHIPPETLTKASAWR